MEIDGAFEDLYRRHERALVSYCRQLLGDAHDALDLVQTVALRAMLALRSGVRPREERAWLRSIAHNEAMTMLRRRRTTANLEDSPPVTAEEPAAAALRRERIEELVDDMRALAPQARRILLMRELAGLSRSTIAAALGISPGAVSQSLVEARAALRADRAGRDLPCHVVRAVLVESDRRHHRARPIQAHVRGCGGCRAWARRRYLEA